MEPFLGQVCFFPFTFNPREWAECNGQVVSIAQNTALYSLLGNRFGGDGVQTFALPKVDPIKANGVEIKAYIALYGIYPNRD